VSGCGARLMRLSSASPSINHILTRRPAPAQAHCGHMLLEGQGCEKNEVNIRLGIKMLSLAAEQNEPIALMALWQMCMMQGDTDQVNSRGLASASRPAPLIICRLFNSLNVPHLQNILKHFTFTVKCEFLLRSGLHSPAAARVRTLFEAFLPTTTTAASYLAALHTIFLFFVAAG
jgi:TPR repeat protein